MDYRAETYRGGENNYMVLRNSHNYIKEFVVLCSKSVTVAVIANVLILQYICMNVMRC